MATVASGLDILADRGPSACGLSTDAALGLLAHPASVDRTAAHAVDRLTADARFRIERILAPEHGLWGHEQDMETVAGARDTRSGLPVLSLYGATEASLRPSAADLAGLDAILVDLQDVGSRYYTFIYSLSFVMEAAGEAGIPVVVLDRPNPIGGVRLEGPVLDPAFSSFVGRFPLPMRHGMTIGELAGLFITEFGVDCELRVVPMQGWSRSMEFEATGLPWVPPSPNMPTPTTARVYPGGCLIEGTNLSEGRGTTLPFELVGAPWLDGRDLVRRMQRYTLPGVLFRDASFRPMFQKQAGQACHGVQVIPTDRDRFQAVPTYLALIHEARAQAPDRFAWRTETYEFRDDRPAIDYLLGRPGLRPLLEAEAGLDPQDPVWRTGVEDFQATRQSMLLYS